MGRKAEPGISYYRMNCGHTTNKKVRLLFNEFGSDGYWIWQCILDEGYRIKGYYFDMNDHDAMSLFATDVCKKQVALVEEVVSGCLRRSLFDKRVAELFGVLTSVMMQEVYLDATYERRKKGTTIELIEDYLLLDIPPQARTSVNISIVPVTKTIPPGNNSIIPGNNPQRRVEKSREEERGSARAGKPPPQTSHSPPVPNMLRPASAPTLAQVQEGFVQLGSTFEEARSFFDYYEGLNWYKGNTPIINWKSFANRWVAGDGQKLKAKQPSPTIPDDYAQQWAKAEERTRRLANGET